MAAGKEDAAAAGNELLVPDAELTQEILMGKAEFATAGDDPAAAQEQIVRRILSAETPEDILREDSTIATREMVGVPLKLEDYRVLRSQLVDPSTGEVKKGVFLIIDAVRVDNDEKVTMNTGAPKIMAQVIRLGQLDRLSEQTVKVAEVGQAKPGQNRALQLIPA